MTDRRTAVDVLLRLSLLFLVITGVVTMHTLGHLEGHHGTTTAISAPCHHATGPNALQKQQPGDDSGASDPLWICLAVLSFMGVLFLVAFRSAHASSRSARFRAARRSPSLGGLRGPPSPALAITRVAVLRI
ncbi:hypothetical protein [Streptosporangium sp. NPDC001681]|uniref:hypothetical protein n=1 Tax=Streptosporangium sp. NPDC001681 TaxID=3154395 RepID=UPI00332B506E